MVKLFLTLTLSLIISALSSSLYSAGTPKDKIYTLGKQAYIYAYPLVLMGVTEEVMTNVSAVDESHTPVNQFANIYTFPAPEFKEVIRPNVDTLYSSAWLNLEKEPIVLSIPDSNNRYYLLPMLDAWTDVFASLGKRTTGTKKVDFVIVGPTWKGTLPSDLKKIAAPTNIVWIIGRTQTNGVGDYQAVNEFQKNLHLTPLSAWGKGEYTPAAKQVNPAIDTKTPPPKQVENMDAVTFFKKFAELLKTNPPHPSDAAMLAELKQIGIIAGKDFDPSKLTSQQIELLNKAIQDAQTQIDNSINMEGKQQNGWNIALTHIGTYDNNYLARAVVARFGLGANIPQDAIYPFTIVDSTGQQLNGKNKYVMHFGKNNMPPVNGFWSLTMYDTDGYFVPNPINRYAIGDRDKLKLNADGSLDIYIQNEKPSEDKVSNWLPAPPGDFNLLLRFYWPKPAIQNGTWIIPGVKRMPS